MAQLTAFGKDVMHRLIDLDRRQAWLCEEIASRTGLYMDSSYMNKILTGQKSTPKIVAAIREILGMEEDHEQGA